MADPRAGAGTGAGILSRLFGYTPFTLVFPAMLVVAVAIAMLIAAFIT